jgi:hypothetical protein
MFDLPAGCTGRGTLRWADFDFPVSSMERSTGDESILISPQPGKVAVPLRKKNSLGAKKRLTSLLNYEQ